MLGDPRFEEVNPLTVIDPAEEEEDQAPAVDEKKA